MSKESFDVLLDLLEQGQVSIDQLKNSAERCYGNIFGDSLGDEGRRLLFALSGEMLGRAQRSYTANSTQRTAGASGNQDRSSFLGREAAK